MTTTVADLQLLPAFRPTHLIAGKRGRQNPVANIALLGDQQTPNDMAPHEILVTSLQEFYQTSPQRLNLFLTALTQSQCSAIIVRLTDFNFTSAIPHALITTCQQHDLPLFTLPRESDYNDLFLAVTQRLFADKQRLLDQYKKLNQHFVTQAAQDGSQQAVLETLASLIHNPVVLFRLHAGREEPLVKSTDVTIPLDRVQINDRQLATVPAEVSHTYFRAPVAQTTSQQLLVKLPHQTLPPHYLGVFAQNQAITDVDFMAIENALNFLQLASLQQTTRTQAQQSYDNDLIDDLFAGNLTQPGTLNQALTHFHLDADQHYRLVLVQCRTAAAQPADAFSQQPTVAHRILTFIRQHWVPVLTRIRPDRILVALPVTTALADLKRPLQRWLQTATASDYQVGISTPSLPRNFGTAVAQTVKTVQLADALLPKARVVTLNDLGFYRCLLPLTNPADLRALVPEELLDLNTQHPELYRTLTTYFAHNHSIKDSAAALYIHPKTMSYRLNKIKRLTTLDFTDAENLFMANVGCHILNLVTQHVLS